MLFWEFTPEMARYFNVRLCEQCEAHKYFWLYSLMQIFLRKHFICMTKTNIILLVIIFISF